MSNSRSLWYKVSILHTLNDLKFINLSHGTYHSSARPPLIFCEVALLLTWNSSKNHAGLSNALVFYWQVSQYIDKYDDLRSQKSLNPFLILKSGDLFLPMILIPPLSLYPKNVDGSIF